MSAEAVSSRVVLVTGVSRYLGAVVAARLAADPNVERVIAVDTTPPQAEAAALLAGPTTTWRGTRRRVPGSKVLGSKVEFVRADIRNPLIAKVLVT
ncbi:MAG: hypothetical protein ACRDT1_16090, partial [Micromonosporaceae bacterium]